MHLIRTISQDTLHWLPMLKCTLWFSTTVNSCKKFEFWGWRINRSWLQCVAWVLCICTITLKLIDTFWMYLIRTVLLPVGILWITLGLFVYAVLEHLPPVYFFFDGSTGYEAIDNYIFVLANSKTPIHSLSIRCWIPAWIIYNKRSMFYFAIKWA